MALDLGGLGGNRKIAVEVEVTGTQKAAAELKAVDRAIEGVGKSATTAATDLLPVQRELAEAKKRAEELAVTSKRTFSQMTTDSTLVLGAVGGITAGMAALLAESARYYAQQSGLIERHRSEIGNLALAWSNFRYRVGEALLGSEQDMTRHLSFMARFVDAAGRLLGNQISSTLSSGSVFAGIGAPAVSGATGDAGLWLPYLSALWRGAPGLGVTAGDRLPFVRNIALPPAMGGAAGWGGQSALGPNGLPLDDIDRAWARQREQIEREIAASQRLTTAKQRSAVVEEAFPAFMEAELSARMRAASMSGQPFAMPAVSSWWFGSGGLADVLPSSPLPGGGMTTLAPAIGSTFTSAGGGSSWLSRMGGSARTLAPQALMSLMTGANVGSTLGGLGGGVLGSALSSTIATAVGGTLGSVLGSAVPIVGTLLGGLAGKWIGGMFGPSAKAREDAAVQPQIDATIADLLERYGGYSGLMSAQNAVGVDVTGAFGSRGKQGYAELNAVIDEFIKKQGDLNERLARQVSLETELGRLREEQKTTWEEAAGVINKYGLNIGGLGRGVQQGATTATASELLNDMQTLFDFGADVGGVLSQLSGQISGLVNTSIRFGTTIPENFRPFIEELARSGQLLDLNGQAMTDLSGIQWGEAVKTQAEIIAYSIATLNATLQELIASIAKDFPNAVKQGVEEGQRIIDGTVWEVPDISVPGIDALSVSTGGYIGPHGVSYFRRGGLVGHPGRPRGTDTVPAWLTPGEYVMSRDAVSRIGVGALAAANSGHTSTIHAPVNIDLRESFVDEASMQRMAMRIERVLMSEIKPHLRYSR